jgi:hypothetical protein
MNTIKEKDILDKSQLAWSAFFGENNPIQLVEFIEQPDGLPDGTLEIGHQKMPFIILEQASLGKILNHFRKYKKATEARTSPIFFLEYASPEVIEKLKAENIFFIDTVGNSYINLPEMKVFVAGRQTVKQTGSIKRAFQKTGIKLLFHFLCQPELVNETYRGLAEKTGISLAAISYIIEELKADHFIIEVNDKKRNLHNVQRLIMKWANSYAEVLRPKIHRGYFRYLKGDIRKIQFNANDPLYLGGEYGVYHFNKAVIPAKLVIYTSERLSTMASRYGIIPMSSDADHTNHIELLEPFWELNGDDQKNPGPHQVSSQAKIVDPILIYADLINSNDYRSIDTAENLLDNEIRNRFLEYKFQW